MKPVSFEYSHSTGQLDDMLAYTPALEDLNLACFVPGALDQNQMPDLAAVEKIANATRQPITSHKAIGDTADILTAIDRIAESKLIQLVLSSGEPPATQQGQGRLSETRDRLSAHSPAGGSSPKRIAAGNITAANLSEVHRALASRVLSRQENCDHYRRYRGHRRPPARRTGLLKSKTVAHVHELGLA